MTCVACSAREKHIHCTAALRKTCPGRESITSWRIPPSKLLTWIIFIIISYPLLTVVIVMTLLNPPQRCKVSIGISIV